MGDPRLDCKFCLKFADKAVPATTLAPQHDGGDEDRPAIWVPVCDPHFSTWYDGEPEDRHLPSFKLAR